VNRPRGAADEYEHSTEVTIVSKSKSDWKYYGGWILVAAVLLLSAYVGWSTLGHRPVGNQVPGYDLTDPGTDTLSLESAGQFGDSFGYINSLFSALAFGGVILTVLMQSQELRLQREEMRLQRQEMEDTRAELKGQKEALEGQKKALAITTQVQALGSVTQAYAVLTAGENERSSQDFYAHCERNIRYYEAEQEKGTTFDECALAEARQTKERSFGHQLYGRLDQLKELEDEAKKLWGMGKSGEEVPGE